MTLALRWGRALGKTGRINVNISHRTYITNPGHEQTSGEPNVGRHLLRAILREGSYLPDAQARHYISQHVLARFRKTDFDIKKGKRDNPVRGPTILESAGRKEARKALSLLSRANNGERKPLLKVLLATYGRLGKRRHELMRRLKPTAGREKIDQILENDPESGDSTEDALSSLGGESRSNPDVTDAGTHEGHASPPKLTPELHALLASQRNAAPPTLTRSNPRRLVPSIPELNARLKPMPKSRVKNLTQRWYADTLDRLLPPLPTEEWYKLRDLARGKCELELVKSFRLPGTSEETRKPPTALELVVSQGRKKINEEAPRGHYDRSPGNRERMTSRFMQRLYAQVFEQCPLMEFNSKKNRWDITWGHHALHGKQHLPVAKDLKRKSGAKDKASRLDTASSMNQASTTQQQLIHNRPLGPP